MIGQTIGHYKIVEKLGAGGMGEVYRAEDTTLKRQVALKVLPAELAGSQERLERFQREAHTLAALDHPNIVHIYSVESDDDVHFLTMQLVRGKALGELIPENGLELDRFFEIAILLADALRAAHEKGIIHRDLKPENVMVDEEGRGKILDFGLAKLRLPEFAEDDRELPTQAMTQEGLILGTVPYMSPEQVQGRRIDHRTDLFSFGILLYEMLCGTRPFSGENTASLVSSIMRDEPEPVREVRKGLPAPLAELVAACLQKDPQERIQSAGDIRDRLQGIRREVESGQAVLTQPTTTAGRPNVWKWALPALLIVLALIVGIWVWTSRDGSTGPEGSASRITSLAVLPLQNLSGDPDQDYFVDGMTEALITDLSKISALKVISRTSAMRYKGSGKALAEIAEELDVDAVIEGSVIREGDQVGITAQLVEVATDQSLWADRYERDLTSILKLQGEVARAIAREIRVTLTAGEETVLTRARAVHPEAYEAYLRGRYHVRKMTAADLNLAEQYYELALAKDPEYASAYAGISGVWGARTYFGVLTRDAAPKMRTAALKAIELDPTAPEGHFALASLATWLEWDWDSGEREFLRAIELDPNFSDARVFYGLLLTALGRFDEARAQMERALESDPLNVMFQAYLGVALFRERRYDDAIAQCHRALSLDPSFGDAHGILAAALHKKGLFEEALEERKKQIAAGGDQEYLNALEQGEAQAGYTGAMVAAAEALVARSNPAYSISIARSYLDAGERERALEWLEKAYQARIQNMIYLRVNPIWDPLREEPGFQELQRLMNFPE
jgi:serine/threonine-protein kinase